MFKVLIDTCVLLDLAKSSEQQPLLTVLEELIKLNELSLITPEIIIEEFNRNKSRIIKEGNQSLSSLFKRVKDVVDKFGDPKKKTATLEQLNDVDYKIPLVGGTTMISIKRIEDLLKSSEIIKISDSVKLKAVQRAIDKKAPFHRQKNSINDALIMETYFECLKDKKNIGSRFAFVTHNKNDFSDPNGNEKNPHPDFSPYFSKIKSLYFIKLSDALYKIRPDLVSDVMIDEDFYFETRNYSEILEAEHELETKVWYNRHQIRAEQIEEGKTKIIPKKDFSIANSQSTIVDEIWEGAKKSASKVEKKYGVENLLWDDFEWGMLNGKLSALRWVMGDEWDSLHT